MVEANQTSRRRYFLQDIPLEEATARWFGALNDAGALVPMPGEDAPLTAPDIVGRVTARPVWAVTSSPHYDAAAMDGIAVRAADTVGATETRPVALDVGSQAVWVDTGDPMPAGMDAVVMIEHVQRDPADPSAVRVYDPGRPVAARAPVGRGHRGHRAGAAGKPSHHPRRPGGLRRRRPHHGSGAPPSPGRS